MRPLGRHWSPAGAVCNRWGCLCGACARACRFGGRCRTADRRNIGQTKNEPPPPNRCQPVQSEREPSASATGRLDALRSKNVAAPENDNVTSRNRISVHHCGRTIPYAFSRRIENMVIGTVVFVVFVAATGAAIVKAFEWYQDVLHGPYLRPQD